MGERCVWSLRLRQNSYCSNKCAKPLPCESEWALTFAYSRTVDEAVIQYATLLRESGRELCLLVESA